MKSYRRRLQQPGPPHPGEILQDLYLEPLKVSVLDAANQLSMTQSELYRFLRGKENLTKHMAFKLAAMFNTTERFWINLQNQYDSRR
jgi:addiction module HigA family antidote